MDCTFLEVETVDYFCMVQLAGSHSCPLSSEEVSFWSPGVG